MLEEMLLEWRHKVEKEARQEGARKGRLEGRLEGQRELLLRQMTLRFGRLPKEVRIHVQQISSAQELTRLTKRILVAQSLEDLGLNLP